MTDEELRSAPDFPVDPPTCRIASLKGVSSHSGRRGLASELVRRGTSTTAVQVAGGWRSAAMPPLGPPEAWTQGEKGMTTDGAGAGVISHHAGGGRWNASGTNGIESHVE